MPKISSGCLHPAHCTAFPTRGSRRHTASTRRNNQRLRQMAELLQYALSVTSASVCAQAMRTIMRRRNAAARALTRLRHSHY